MNSYADLPTRRTPVVRFGYDEYMAHHYAYMTHVTKVREPESYAEAAKDANWPAVMEEEMQALAENETWDQGCEANQM